MFGHNYKTQIIPTKEQMAEIKLNELLACGKLYVISHNKFLTLRLHQIEPQSTIERYRDILIAKGLEAVAYDKKDRGYTSHTEWTLEINESLDDVIAKLDQNSPQNDVPTTSSMHAWH